MTEAAVTLPGGVWRNGTLCREARVRALTGADEEHLTEGCGALPPAERCTALLARGVTRIGTSAPGAAGVRRLSLGDREALMLAIRRITLGDRIETTAACPAPACARRFDVALTASSLLVPPYSARETWVDAAIESRGSRFLFRVRRVVGADQEAAARTAASDGVDAAIHCVLSRCVRRRAPRDRRPLPDHVRVELARALAELDPQAEVSLQLRCPECGHAFELLFDSAAYLLRELDARAAERLRQVHLLAFHYGWSEPDILALTCARRERYIGLLTAHLAGGRS
jgi:hypothetical protein